MSSMPARQVPQKPDAPSAPAAGIHPEQARLRAIILELLERRGRDKTICPSDAARALAGKDFRPLMDAARAAAAELVASGEIEVTQRGEVVDIAQARGPVRLRRRPST
ncbi:MAG: DUF3253 domain-containing protein [Solirubrobacteraceae bacterium]